MSNASLRARFGSDGPSAPTVSRLIRDTVDAKLIKSYDPNSGKKSYEQRRNPKNKPP